ncbi:MAG: dihydrolipoyl dehydrogenase [Myxococcota bacterium]|mgnify:CR=1 FL=1
MPTIVKTEVLVIGAGPGGYVAALRAAQLGKKVVVVERDKPGGTCLNVGCIPSKALITAAKLVDKIREAGEMGITVEGLKVDFARMQAWKEGVVGKLTGGVKQLLKAAGVTLVTGEARFVSPRAVEVVGTTEPTRIEFDACIVATGSRPVQVPGFAFDGKRVVDSTGALAFAKVPDRLCVIGGGYIGLETGTAYAKLGSKITVVEMTEHLLPGTDPDLVTIVERKLKKKGVAVHLKTRAKGFEDAGGALRVAIEAEGHASGPSTVECDAILVTVGRAPVTDTLDLARAGVKTDAKGFIPVDEARRTNVPHIYAIGDIAGGPMLAHKAYREGEVAAEVIAGKKSAFDPRCIPAVIFTDPEIAYAGLSEPEARAAGRDVLIGKFAFSANGRALTAAETDGFVKVVVGREEHDILGVAIVGPEASDLIAEACLAIEMGALVPDVALTIHAHPTLSETVAEAVRAAVGEALHAAAKPSR